MLKIVATAFLIAGSITICVSGQVTMEPRGKSMYLVIYRPGPGWLQGKDISEQPLKEHGRYMLALFQKGLMKFAGPFADNEGGAVVLEVTNEAEAKALINEDPAIKSGIFTQELHPWRLVPWDKYLNMKHPGCGG